MIVCNDTETHWGQECVMALERQDHQEAAHTLEEIERADDHWDHQHQVWVWAFRRHIQVEWNQWHWKQVFFIVPVWFEVPYPCKSLLHSGWVEFFYQLFRSACVILAVFIEIAHFGIAAKHLWTISAHDWMKLLETEMVISVFLPLSLQSILNGFNWLLRMYFKSAESGEARE